jgi:hypothetical protein
VRDGFAVMDLLLEAAYLRWNGEHDRIARDFPPRYRELWLRYNRPGGLDDSVKQNFRPKHVCEVLVSFDTEDYTCPKNADGIADLTRICLEEGIVPHHQVVGELAKKLVEWNRQDVIDLMKKCVIGTQTRYHTLHPDICEMTDVADYNVAHDRILAQEATCVGMLRAVFGRDAIDCFVPPGNSVTYAGMAACTDLGMTIYGAAGFADFPVNANNPAYGTGGLARRDNKGKGLWYFNLKEC